MCYNCYTHMPLPLGSRPIGIESSTLTKDRTYRYTQAATKSWVEHVINGAKTKEINI